MSRTEKSPEASITIKEIFSQPELWKEIYESIQANRGPIQEFMQRQLNKGNLEIIFAGAGSSSFIGEMLVVPIRLKGFDCRAVASTDIVTHPQACLSPTRPTLLVSFARSGNSPESIASINLANKISSNVRHLIVTCNAEGALAKLPESRNCKVILLPEMANDKGLAMIGSVTGMMLAFLLILEIEQIEEQKSRVLEICQQAQGILKNQASIIEQKANDLDFKRLVCLGSGALFALARESHLKVQELSDGSIVGKFDSFLGFRHGPKAVANENTLMLYFMSSDPYVSKYEVDLVQSIKQDLQICHSMAIAASKMNLPVDYLISLEEPQLELEDHWLMIPYLLPAQLLAAYKSRALGLDPDSPSKRGAIHRVVQGVNIYPYRPERKT